MPLYEFDCPDCAAALELLAGYGETPACPSCGAARLVKRLSVPAAPKAAGGSLPIGSGCEPSLPPCARSNCCRLPQN
ncbi:MAG TPA: FmdB family zinc ribbon protein [Planctomycetia bacterium]|nr:FmdB family zinc ribbon protein [Planctomycetia bacterium]